MTKPMSQNSAIAASSNKALGLIKQASEGNNDLLFLKAKIFNFILEFDQALIELTKVKYKVGTEQELQYLDIKSIIFKDSDQRKQAEAIAKKMLDKAMKLYGTNSIAYAEYLMKYTRASSDELAYRNRNIENYKKIIKIYINNNLSKDTRLAKAYRRLSIDYRKKGLLDKALININKADEIYKAIYGDEHLINARVLNTKAAISNLNKNFVQAKRSYQLTLGIKEKYYGANNPRLSATYLNIGLVYINEGIDNNKAISYINQALSLLEPIKKDKKSVYNYYYRSLVLPLIRTQQYQKAETILNELIPYYINKNYIAGKSLSESRVLLAVVYYKQGKIEESQKLLDMSIDILRKNSLVSDVTRIEAENLYNNLYQSK